MSTTSRLPALDWMRGWAVVLMIQTHAYQAWLSADAKKTTFYVWSRFVGGFPAPLFLFLAGAALALLADARFRRGATPAEVRREGLKRAAEVGLYALGFRVWMYFSAGSVQPASLLRVDVLNCMAVAMALAALVMLPWRAGSARVTSAVAGALALAVLTPLAWDGPTPTWLPTPLLGYLSGRVPRAPFPLFPWGAYLASGVAVGVLLARAAREGRLGRCSARLALLGALLLPLGWALDRLPALASLPRYDFWWTSPNYVLMKTGTLLLVLGLAEAWVRTPWARWPSALRLFGRTSLLIYWLHIEIVYGRWVAPAARQALDVGAATWALAWLLVAMLLVAWLRVHGTARLRAWLDARQDDARATA
jgi:uncharacterized membrane protein